MRFALQSIAAILATLYAGDCVSRNPPFTPDLTPLGWLAPGPDVIPATMPGDENAPRPGDAIRILLPVEQAPRLASNAWLPPVPRLAELETESLTVRRLVLHCVPEGA